jgi:hypothetical protein
MKDRRGRCPARRGVDRPDLRALAAAVQRLAPHHRDPERFHLDRDTVVKALLALARDPCGACSAPGLERQLAWLRRQLALAIAQRDRAEESRSVLVRMVLEAARARPLRRRRAGADPRQLTLALPGC